MSKGEDKLWADVREGMATRWHAQRHEDKYSTGIPDVSYGIQRKAEGWIELKYLPKLPKSGEKPWDFSYHHFTADQRNWLEQRVRYGPGLVFLMCRFGGDVTAIWNWTRIRTLLGQEPLDTILGSANAQWTHGIDSEELEYVLTSNRIIRYGLRL